MTSDGPIILPGVVSEAVRHLRDLNDGDYFPRMSVADMGAIQYVLEFVEQIAEPPWGGRPVPHHPKNLDCPVCGKSCGKIGLTHLAYGWTVCRCDAADYDHLAEQLYHADCLAEGMLDLSTAAMLRDAAHTCDRYKLGKPTAERIRTFLDKHHPPITSQDEPS